MEKRSLEWIYLRNYKINSLLNKLNLKRGDTLSINKNKYIFRNHASAHWAASIYFEWNYLLITHCEIVLYEKMLKSSKY
jgi:hypothetical protein